MYEIERDKKIVKNLENEEWFLKYKNIVKKEFRLFLKKFSFDKSSLLKVSFSVKGREKRKIIVEDSDEEEMFRLKRFRN